jgi:hypothetical protein
MKILAYSANLPLQGHRPNSCKKLASLWCFYVSMTYSNIINKKIHMEPPLSTESYSVDIAVPMEHGFT